MIYEVGKFYNIPCIVLDSLDVIDDMDEDILWRDLDYVPFSKYKFTNILPIIDHLHNDVENGQIESHYHIDTRFKAQTNNGIPLRIVYPFKNGEVIKYLHRECIRDSEIMFTNPKFIKKSKLKHQCIYKGKCPHRGYDLSQVQPTLSKGCNPEWEITCPLHGLRFNADTKQLINDK